jgi:hypothetical protein
MKGHVTFLEDRVRIMESGGMHIFFTYPEWIQAVKEWDRYLDGRTNYTV